MISALLPFVLSVVTGVAPKPAPAATSPEPAIRISLNHRTYDRGDRAHVNVRVRDDGYVVVLHADASGHVRVLFPVDPGDDNFLKAGQDYEIRGRGDREAFQVTTSGTGTVYAAVSPDPYHFDSFVRNDHWDYGQLDDSALVDDPETGMTNIVEQMTNGQHFDYDVTTYTSESTYASTQHVYLAPASYSCFYDAFDPWCDGYYPGPSYFGFGIGFGSPYYGYGYGYRPYGYGFGFGFGYPIYGYGYGRGSRYYGSSGYGYRVGHGWSYNNHPVVLGPGGGVVGGRYTSRGGYLVGSTGTTIGYRNRSTMLTGNGGVSPLYGVSRFNTQNRGPSRGDIFNRRSAPSARENIGTSRGGSDITGMRPATRSEPRIEIHPTRVEPRTNVDSRPTRAEPRTNVDSRPTRAEPRSAPRSEPRETRAEPRNEPRSQPRSEPRAEPRSRAPEASRSHGGGGGGGGGGGRRGGGGGGHRP